MLDWYQLVYLYGINPYIAHRAFLEIAEYQAVIKKHGMGPAKDEPGFEPGIPFGRSTLWLTPKIQIGRRSGALHVWPADSDEVAQAFRNDVARRYEMKPPSVPT
jgi:hypothetical protein